MQKILLVVFGAFGVAATSLSNVLAFETLELVGPTSYTSSFPSHMSPSGGSSYYGLTCTSQVSAFGGVTPTGMTLYTSLINTIYRYKISCTPSYAGEPPPSSITAVFKRRGHVFTRLSVTGTAGKLNLSASTSFGEQAAVQSTGRGLGVYIDGVNTDIPLSDYVYAGSASWNYDTASGKYIGYILMPLYETISFGSTSGANASADVSASMTVTAFTIG